MRIFSKVKIWQLVVVIFMIFILGLLINEIQDKSGREKRKKKLTGDAYTNQESSSQYEENEK